jgi:hypothetical protein
MNELQRLLSLLDAWQCIDPTDHAWNELYLKLATFDLIALRNQIKQHSEQLRSEAIDGAAGDGISSDVLNEAADFLAPEDQ